MRTLFAQFLSLFTIFLFLEATPAEGLRINIKILKDICDNNPPPAFQRLCKKYFGVTCPSRVELGDWEYTGTDVDSSINNTAAVDCPGKQLQKYERRSNLSTIPSECRSKVTVDVEEQYRCPPTTKEKAAALTRIFGSFGPPPSTFSVTPATSNATEEPTSAPVRRAKRQSQDCYYNDATDLAVLIDTSSSVGPSNFYQAVENVATLIENTCNDFKCGKPQIRVAVVTFGSFPTTVFDFAYSAANHHSRQDIVNSILTTKYKSGSTATRSAVEHVRDNIFTESNGMRRHSKKKLLVLTDGNHNGGEDPKHVAKSLHMRPGTAKVDVFALGIGNGISFENLKDLVYVSDHNKILPLLSYSSFAEFSEGVQLVVADALLSTSACTSNPFKK